MLLPSYCVLPVTRETLIEEMFSMLLQLFAFRDTDSSEESVSEAMPL